MFFFIPQPSTDDRDEEVREKDIGHVAVPGDPGAVFVVPHAEIGLALEEALLDGPAKGRDRSEGLEGGGLRGVREGILHLPVGGLEQDEPLGPGGVLFGFGDGIDAQGADSGPQRALGRVLEDQGDKGGRLCDLGHGLGLFREADLGGRGSLGALAGRHLPRGRIPEDAGVAPDRGKVPEIRRERIQELPVGAVEGVASDPPGREASLLAECLDHLARDPGLGRKREVLGNAGLLAAIRKLLRLGKPLFRHVEAGVEKAVPPGADVAHEDARLAVLDLAETAAILAGHPDRLLSLLDEGAVVDGEHRQLGLIRSLGGDLERETLLVEMLHGLFVPFASGHEPLEAPDPDLHGKRDGLDALSHERAAKAGQIDDAMGPDPLVPEDAGKGVVECAELLGDPGDIRRRQGLLVRERRRCGRPPGEIRNLGTLLVLPLEAHDRAKSGVQHRHVDLLALTVVVVPSAGLLKSGRATETEKSRRLVARSGKVPGIDEGLHDPGADPEAPLPVGRKPGQSLSQHRRGKILDRDFGKDQKTTVADNA